MNEKLEFSEKNFITINHILMQEKGKNRINLIFS